MGKSLVTKAEYKDYAGISSTNSDAEIDSLIPKVSELVKNYCRRTFVDHIDDVKTEVFDGGFDTILLGESPVVQVVSVQVSSDYGKTYTNMVNYTDWVAGDDAVISLGPKGFPKLIRGYRVRYFAGYEELPADLKLAAMDLITYYMKSSSAVHSTKPISPNTHQIEYIQGSTFPSHIRRVLDLYKANWA